MSKRFRLALLLAATAVAVVGASLPASADCYSNNGCGGQSQRPCNFWECIPSCSGGLTQLIAANYCTAFDGFGFPVPCGGTGERPCTIAEHIPSCWPNHFEYPIGQTCNAKDAQGYPTWCGDDGEIPCNLALQGLLFITSCKPNHVEDAFFGVCRAMEGDGSGYPAYCGGHLEPACNVGLQALLGITSCRPNHVEQLGNPVGTCHAIDAEGYPLDCGDDAEAACTVDLQVQLGITSCKPGLVEEPGDPVPSVGTCRAVDSEGWAAFCGDAGEPVCPPLLQALLVLPPCKHGTDVAGGSCAFTPAAEPTTGSDVVVAQHDDLVLYGIADTHSHLFAGEGFGGKLFHGDASSPYGVKGALHDCSYEHGPGGATDLVGDGVNGTIGHANDGHPSLGGWPHWHSGHHQQMYYRWLERAYLGGLRLLVVNAVNNEVLCQLSTQNLGYGCDDMPAVDRQIAAVNALEAQIDAESGGPGQGWFRIARTPAEARAIVQAGKLAVVLGIEVDALFTCKPGACSTAQVDAALDAYEALGVRHVFPLHVFDNDFGGAAVYQPIFNYGNRVSTGSFFGLRDCSPEGYAYTDDEPLSPAYDALLAPLGIGSPMVPAAPAHCNLRGLTPLGEHLVSGLMDRGMLIDVDHMSALALDAVLDIAEQRAYPLIAGHTGFVDISLGEKRSEGQKTAQQVARIRDLGGLVAPILFQGAASETAYAGAGVANDCDASAKSWAQAYRYASDAMAAGDFLHAVPLGSDWNGMIARTAPRFGADACSGNAAQAALQTSAVAYPFPAHDGSGSFDRLTTGARVYDINTDGLANVGLLPDFVEELKQVGLGETDLGPLFRSAEAYIAMWERTTRGPECSDGIDDDGDGLVDAADPGCASPDDLSERTSSLPCDDGLDNDGDGRVDADDPRCSSPTVATEKQGPACGLGFEAVFALAALRLRRRGRRQR